LAGGQRTLAQEVAHAIGQVEQAQRVGHMRARLADRLGQRVLRQAELLDEAAIALGLPPAG
jgi:hypothetical protein